MNKLKSMNRAFICLAIALVVFSGCSKDNPNPNGEDILKEFVNKSYEDQVKAVDQEIAKYENKSYRLWSITMLNEDGTKKVESISPDDCSFSRKISIMAKQAAAPNRNYKMENVGVSDDCGVYKGEVVLELSKSQYSDYKVLMNFTDTKNMQPFESYKGVLQLIDGTSTYFTVYTGDYDSDGKFVILKEYKYIEFE